MYNLEINYTIGEHTENWFSSENIPMTGEQLQLMLSLWYRTHLSTYQHRIEVYPV